MDSILTSIKKLLGIDGEYTAFDADLIMHINSVFMILAQMGIGPSNGYRITGSSELWNDYLPADTKNLESIKTYIAQKVRLMFDPPTSSIVMECTKQVIDELEWRLYTEAEFGENGEEGETIDGTV